MNNFEGTVSKKKSLFGIVNKAEEVPYGTVSKAENINVKELYFANYYEFPPLGETDCLYIAEDENAVYRFSSEKKVYLCIGRDYEEISTIQSVL